MDNYHTYVVKDGEVYKQTSKGYPTRLRDEERLVYEQTSKSRRNSRPGGTLSGRERRRTCPRLTSKS